MQNSHITPSVIKTRQIRQQLVQNEDYLSYELGQAVKKLPPFYTRILAGSISLLVFSILTWAHFCKVDEVAVTQGKLIPSEKIRPLRSVGEGVIKEIKIKEGDRVNKEDVLIERAPDLSEAEINRLENSAKLIKQDLARLEAEHAGKGSTGVGLQDQLLRSRLEDFKNRRAAAVAESKRQLAIKDASQQRLIGLKQNLSNAKTNLSYAQTSSINAQKLLQQSQKRLNLARKREQSFASLASSGAVARMDYIESQERVTSTAADVTRVTDQITQARDRITDAQDKITSLVRDIAVQEQEILQAQQAYTVALNQAKRLDSERTSEILTQINRRREELTNIQGELTKVKTRRRGETIKAPTQGIVYNLKATLGPVQPGEELLSIVSPDNKLVLETKVLNRDIGFIKEGMDVKVKIATFPFQEFGTIDGKVIKISPNAISDEKLGSVFLARIKLARHSMKVRDNKSDFTPGMTATAEIVTRQKSILMFFIEPIIRRFDEAFSAR